MESPTTVEGLAFIYSLHKEHVSLMNKIIQKGQQEHPVQRLTPRLAPAQVLVQEISASFPCSCSKMSSRVKERKKT